MDASGHDPDRRCGALQATLLAELPAADWADVVRRAAAQPSSRRRMVLVLVVAALVVLGLAAAGREGYLRLFGANGRAPTTQVRLVLRENGKLLSDAEQAVTALPAAQRHGLLASFRAQKVVAGTARTAGSVDVPGASLTLWTARTRNGAEVCGVLGSVPDGSSKWVALDLSCGEDAASSVDGSLSGLTQIYLGHGRTLTVGRVDPAVSSLVLHAADGSTRTFPVDQGWYAFLGRSAWWTYRDPAQMIGITAEDRTGRLLGTSSVGQTRPVSSRTNLEGSRLILAVPGAQIRLSKRYSDGQELDLVVDRTIVPLGAVALPQRFDPPSPNWNLDSPYALSRWYRTASGRIAEVVGEHAATVTLSFLSGASLPVTLTPVDVVGRHFQVALVRLSRDQQLVSMSATDASGRAIAAEIQNGFIACGRLCPPPVKR